VELGGDEAIYDLSRAVAMVRPQVPAWSFATAPLAVPAGLTRGRGEGDMLTLDVAVTLIKRRTPGGS
jgi:hypothetical protein